MTDDNSAVAEILGVLGMIASGILIAVSVLGIIRVTLRIFF